MATSGQTHRVTPLEGKMREKRRGPRMNSRVPVALEWSEAHRGHARHENAHTRIVNFYGCLLVSPETMPLERHLRITNLANRRTISAIVVYQGNRQVDGWELGVELIEPEMDFWGIDL